MPAAGVTREAVTRWAGHHPAFQAALNLYRTTLAQEQVDTARRIRTKTLVPVEEQLDGRLRNPLTVYRILNQSKLAIGCTDPRAILSQEVERTDRHLQATEQLLGLEALLESIDDPQPTRRPRAKTKTLAHLASTLSR